jgi:hypothetical protein
MGALFAAIASCSKSSPPKPRGIVHAAQDYGYPMDDVLRMNHPQVKGTHNSYHVETAGNTDPTKHYTHAPLDVQADVYGVRGFELDPRFVASSGRFEVFHEPFIDEGTTCRALTDCIATLRGWSEAHPAHEPLLVQIEPKDEAPDDDPETYFHELESEILAAWPREQIIAPDDVQGDAATLRDAVTMNGFPTLGQSRGCVLFYVDNHDRWRDYYTRGGTSLEGRLLFSDGADGGPLEAVIINNDPTKTSDIDDAVRAGFIVRTFADQAGGPNHDALSLTTGAHVLSTDFEAKFSIPAGTPSRCNPISAPPGCTPQAIEDPSRLK